MARLTDTNMSAAERTALAHLQHAVGFAPKIVFGRDRATNSHILQRLLAEGTPLVYAIAEHDSTGNRKGGVREFRLLVAPVHVKLANGTRPAAKARRPKAAHAFTRTKAQRARISAAVKKSWETRRAKGHATAS